MSAKKSWSDKLHSNKLPQTKRIDFRFADIPAQSLMFIATPLVIDEYIKQIPRGINVSFQTLRKDLALDNHADCTCPITTGIFLRIVAEANFEKYQQTNSLTEITPFWRVIEPNSPLSKKLSFGQEFILQQRKAENISE
jgi:hypothetical protein